MADNNRSPENIPTAAAAIASSQPRFKFTIPDAARTFPSDPKVVVLKPITVAEESRAYKSAQNKGGGSEIAYEVLKASVVEADGVSITWENGAKDIFVEGLSPRVRQLLLKAYERVHIPQEADLDDFFRSQTAML